MFKNPFHGRKLVNWIIDLILFVSELNHGFLNQCNKYCLYLDVAVASLVMSMKIQIFAGPISILLSMGMFSKIYYKLMKIKFLFHMIMFLFLSQFCSLFHRRFYNTRKLEDKT